MRAVEVRCFQSNRKVQTAERMPDCVIWKGYWGSKAGRSQKRENQKQAGDCEGGKNEALEMALDFGDWKVTGALRRAISVEGWVQEPEVRQGGTCQRLLCSCVKDGNREGDAVVEKK